MVALEAHDPAKVGSLNMTKYSSDPGSLVPQLGRKSLEPGSGSFIRDTSLQVAHAEVLGHYSLIIKRLTLSVILDPSP